MNEKLQKQNEELQKQIDNLNKQIAQLTLNPTLPEHQHTGYDSTRVLFSDIDRKKIWIHHTIIGTDAATAANYAVFFIVPFACIVTEFREVHQTAGSDAGAVTLDLEKLTGTQALDAGVSVLNATLSLKSTANTVQTATLSNTSTSRSLVRGDRLALKDSGTPTSVANIVTVTELTIV